LKQRLPLFAAALWWGSLTVIGFLVVPLLFANLATPAIAGGMAAKLFSAQTWVSLGCGLLLVLMSRGREGSEIVPWAAPVLMFLLGGMLLALLAEFGVAPRIVARENLKLWHSVGSAMYLLQWVCAGIVLWRLGAKEQSA
jgi:glucan phosphoethanolaminetransferase (alkaline phosphatase superfamily)